MNRPENDRTLIGEAGISLDRALFPLLVRTEQLGPIGVVELASRVGRDYTTVSRQVAKMQSIDLVSRRIGSVDRRVNEATVTPEGKAVTDALDAARAIGSGVRSFRTGAGATSGNSCASCASSPGRLNRGDPRDPTNLTACHYHPHSAASSPRPADAEAPTVSTHSSVYFSLLSRAFSSLAEQSPTITRTLC